MFSRKVAYEVGSEGLSSFEKLSKKISSDLRAYIRRVNIYPIFCPEWGVVVDTIQQIASFAVMEDKVPEKKEDGSLWDKSEMTVRYIVEEGKLNVLIRMIAEQHEFIRSNEEQMSAMVKEAKENFKWSSEDDILCRLDINDQSITALLKLAFQNVECWQTCDLWTTFKHVNQVLLHALERASPRSSMEMEQFQEFSVFSYLSLCFNFMEELDIARINDMISELDIMNLTFRILIEYQTIPILLLKEIALFLAALFSNEYYLASPKDHWKDQEPREMLLPMDKVIVKRLEPDFELRKQIRPLLDLIKKAKFKMSII